MKIVCIGWGSLIWNPGKLKLKGEWQKDGPIIPIEFARQSNDNRITLVIDTSAKPVQTLWSFMSTRILNTSIKSLQDREGTTLNNIHFVTANDKVTDPIKLKIQKWLIEKNIDVAIWTGLSCRFNKIERKPTIREVINHLSTLNSKSKILAKQYICKAPKQINTKYRRIIEKELGWVPYNR